MKKASKQTQSVWLFIGFYLLAGVFNLLTKTRITLVDSLMFCLNFAVYAGMILFWAQSVRTRLLPSGARSYILLSAALMLGAILFRTFKYRILTGQILVSRYTTYAYWTYTLLIPTLFLMTAIRIWLGEKKDEGRKELFLLIPALLLCLLALTNDLHGFVYLPKVELSAFDIKSGLYSYGAGFYLLHIWMGLMAFSGITILLRVTKRRSGSAMGHVFVALGLWLGMELLNVLVVEPKHLPTMYNTPEIRVFAMMAIWEICIRGRLIPHNENHVRFFEKLSLPVQITDREFSVVYQSAVPIAASKDELLASLTAPVYITEDTKLSGMALPAGYAFWTEDESELHKENRRLESANELLSEENDLIRVERQLKEKKTRLDAETEVYRQISAAIYPKQREIDTLLEGVSPEDKDFPATLAKVCVLNAWSKRKGNLLLLSEDSLPKNNRELFLALQESARFLSCCGIEAAAVGEEYTDFPLPLVHELYDSFEAVLEAYLPFLKRMTVSLTADGLRMALEASEEPTLPPTALPVERRHEEGTTYLTIRKKTGGEAA